MVGKLALSVAEAVEASGIGRTMLYAAIRDGLLVTRKAGRRTVILTGDLSKFLSDLPVRETKEPNSENGD